MDQVDLEAIEAIKGFSKETSDLIASVHSEMTRPSVLYRPQLSMRGGNWEANYGDFRAHGKSPKAAMADFDLRFNEEREQQSKQIPRFDPSKKRFR